MKIIRSFSRFTCVTKKAAATASAIVANKKPTVLRQFVASTAKKHGWSIYR
jgi:hypothetical protein